MSARCSPMSKAATSMRYRLFDRRCDYRRREIAADGPAEINSKIVYPVAIIKSSKVEEALRPISISWRKRSCGDFQPLRLQRRERLTNDDVQLTDDNRIISCTVTDFAENRPDDDRYHLFPRDSGRPMDGRIQRQM